MEFKVTKGTDAHKIEVGFTVETNQDLIDKFTLGKKMQKCKLCGATGEFQTWICIENYFGWGDEYNYFECLECETLQIEAFPEDIAKYYPPNYYSFYQPNIEPARFGAVRDTRMILDVGCGSGSWLCFLASIGCVNLFGCDLFIEKDLEYSNNVKIKKGTIHEMDGQYDVIHIGNTFGSMPDPRKAFESFDRLLKHEKNVFSEAPKIEISTPIFPNTAFDIYGSFWYKLDAPRLFFVHSLKSIRMLADEYGFLIKDITYEDFGSQYFISRLCQLGVPVTQWQQRYDNDSAYAKLKEQQPIHDTLAKCAALNGCADAVTVTLTRR